MKNTRVILALGGALGLVLSSQLAAQEPEDTVRSVIESSSGVMAARADRSVAMARAEQVRLGEYETQLDAGLARRQVRSADDSMEWQLGVSRRFRWPAKRQLDLDLARTESALAQARYTLSWQGEAEAWVRLWSAWSQASALVEVMDRRVEAARLRRDAEQVRLQHARGRAVDVDRLDRDLALARASLDTSRQSAELARLALEARFPGTAEPGLAEGLDTETCGDPDAGEALDTAIALSPALRVARLELDWADLQRRRAAYDQRADPQLGVQVFQERDGAETGLGVSVSLPITGGLRQARLVAAEGEQTSRAARLASAEQALRQTFLTLEARNLRSGLRVEQAGEALSAAQTVLDRLERGRDLEAVTVLDILEARTALWSAREVEIAARAEQVEARLLRGILLQCVLMPGEANG